MKLLVYGLVDPRTGEICYVGQGQHNRPKGSVLDKKGRLRDTPKGQWIMELCINGISAIIEILQECSTKEEAYLWEEFFIKSIGRKDLGNGPLLNLSDGGRGVGKNLSGEVRQKISEALTGRSPTIGNKGRHFSLETRRRMSESLKGRIPTRGMTGKIPWNKGKRLSEEGRRKLSENNMRPMKGKHHSPEARKKISEAKRAFWEKWRQVGWVRDGEVFDLEGRRTGCL
ncbi:MAG: NUMOD3 domain-containing DNA-binding protein [Desulfobacterales bacterium]|nr:NUMOD3 domain-containing DNA-binding protein [Desulfobacterales bacterium]